MSKSENKSKTVQKYLNWDLGSRYRSPELIGKGSYGQVAKALDK